MEKDLLLKIQKAVSGIKLPKPQDVRDKLATNSSGRKWKIRDVKQLKGMVWHQELGWGSIEGVAKYHTGKNSHLVTDGTESIAYTFSIRRDGQILLCNDLNKATWSQGYKGRKGDENAEFVSVMFEGMFKGTGITDNSASEPNLNQMLSAMLLWKVCKEFWNWQDHDLYGHFNFGKPACPGDTLQTIINAIQINSKKDPAREFNTSKQRQEVLKELGFYKGAIDGIWGLGSKASLISFQRKKGLIADGIWGSKTEIKILELLSL